MSWPGAKWLAGPPLLTLRCVLRPLDQGRRAMSTRSLARNRQCSHRSARCDNLHPNVAPVLSSAFISDFKIEEPIQRRKAVLAGRINRLQTRISSTDSLRAHRGREHEGAITSPPGEPSWGRFRRNPHRVCDLRSAIPRTAPCQSRPKPMPR
jgi:hypothetical protein